MRGLFTDLISAVGNVYKVALNSFQVIRRKLRNEYARKTPQNREQIIKVVEELYE